MQKQQEGKGSGFLITCDKNKEKQAVKDAYNFLNQYIEQIYGDIETDIIRKQLQAQGKDHNLENEMQARSALKNKLRLLSSVETNVNCLIFIRINQNPALIKIDPHAIVNKIMKDVHDENKQITRFCHKILPVQRSFKAEHFKMLDEIDLMFQGRDNSEIKSWALSFKCRNNSKFNYKEVLGKTEEIAKKYDHFVDVYYPQWTVAVEIAHHLMCLAIVEKYKEYDEFRLHKKGRKLEFEPKQEVIRQKKQEKKREGRDQQHGKNAKQQSKHNKQQQPEVKQDKPAREAHDEQNNDEKEKQREKLLGEKIKAVEEDQDVDFI